MVTELKTLSRSSSIVGMLAGVALLWTAWLSFQAVGAARSPQGAASFPYGVVSGRVLGPGGMPVPDARVAAIIPESSRPIVRAYQPNLRDLGVIVGIGKSDRNGRYRVENLPPGSYHVVAGTTWYPATTKADAAVAVQVAAGAVVEGLDIAQVAGFAVRGRLAIAPALQHSPPITIRLWGDDFGRNRPPGPDLIMETPLQPDLTFEFLNVPPGVHGISTNIALPRSPSSTSDITVQVVDRDISGLELGAGLPGVRLTGKVVSSLPPGTALPELEILVSGSAETQEMRTPVNADGTFEFLRIPLARPARGGASSLTLQAVAGRLGQMKVWGAAPLAFSEQDVRGVEIPLDFGAQVRGRVVVEGANGAVAAPAAGLPAISVPVATTALRGLEMRPAMSVDISVSGSAGVGAPRIAATTPIGGVFNLPLLAGRYTVEPHNVPEGYRVQSMSYGATDLLTSPLEVTMGRSPDEIQIVLTQTGLRNGTISGQILNSDGTPAISVTVGAARPDVTQQPSCRFNAQLFTRMAQTDSMGRYRLENLPPGPYIVGAGRAEFPGGQFAGPCGVGPFMGLLVFLPGVSDRAGARTINLTSGATLDAGFRFPRPQVSTPVFTVRGRVTNMIARDLEPSQPNRVWPGHTGLQIHLYLNPAGEAFPPLGPAAADGPDPCSRGLSFQGAGDVAPDGLYEVRNLPPGRYRVCIGGRPRLYKDNILVNADVDGINFNLP